MLCTCEILTTQYWKNQRSQFIWTEGFFECGTFGTKPSNTESTPGWAGHPTILIVNSCLPHCTEVKNWSSERFSNLCKFTLLKSSREGFMCAWSVLHSINSILYYLPIKESCSVVIYSFLQFSHVKSIIWSAISKSEIAIANINVCWFI